MNVPEALNATRRAIDVFAKTVEMAREELGAEMSRIHSQLLEEQPKETRAETRIIEDHSPSYKGF